MYCITDRLDNIDNLKKEGFKICIIDDIDYEVTTSVIMLSHLMPPPSILHSEEFREKYLNYLDTGTSRHTMLMLALSIVRNNKIAFVISNEYDIDFLKIFGEYFRDYGIYQCSYRNYKSGNCDTTRVDRDIEKYIESEIYKYVNYARDEDIVSRGALIRCIKDLGIESKILRTYRKPLEELSIKRLYKICRSYVSNFSKKVNSDDVFLSPFETGGKSLGEVSKDRRKSMDSEESIFKVKDY